MARRPTDLINIEMTRAEAQALAVIADRGLRVVEALSLIQNTGPAERGLKAVREAANSGEAVTMSGRRLSARGLVEDAEEPSGSAPSTPRRSSRRGPSVH